MKEFLDEILYSEEDIDKKVRELGAQITKDYKDKDLLVVGILKGAVSFMSDLIKRIDLPLTVDYMDVTSYEGVNTSGQVKILKDLDNSIEGKDVLIVEDIIDTGTTLNYIKNLFENRLANSVTIATLLNKPKRRKIDVYVKYIGYDIEDLFVIGYGLDYNEIGRNLPYIGTLKKEIYS
ncbi:hypoxanthine phosphoribosyltransferase [Peptoniphilus koenoeneniae]|uniref:Hypoxanthine phosphoribosyltransferase n=1 Tax=Peptoniphilus koenoeneniae TaxID=507751 RepID=A0ABU0ATA7_9FIRM|nr:MULTISPECIES: hypoxanthine phosphoribosyltransferase [Peptoniphilus]ERT56769.1 hypoxanthine phosphoribosyltransferase [Peptoniphilus sp. BV3C26]MDQ0274099.1 hypoxanthine phosphoribosyltransferase [Peptoniphilus koenoeneniae]